MNPEEFMAMAELFQRLEKDPELLAKYQQLTKLANDMDEQGEPDPEKMKALVEGMQELQTKGLVGDTGEGGSGGESKAALSELLAAQMSGSGLSGLGSIAKGKDSINLPGQQKLGPDGITKDEVGLMMTPEPGFVLKTKDDAEGKKVFINICQSDLIGVPEMKKQLDHEGNEVEGMSVPVSVGQARQMTDKAGKHCVVYDCVMNPKVLEDAKTDKTGTQRDFLCQLAIEYVESKYKTTLDRRYKLPKLRYKGEISKQRVRDITKRPKIQEVSSSKPSAAAAKKRAAAAAAAPAPEEDLRELRVTCAAVDAAGRETPLECDPAEVAEASLDRAAFPAALRFTAEGLRAGTDPAAVVVELSARWRHGAGFRPGREPAAPGAGRAGPRAC
ncbi:unnamed protein product [Heterosigma akashiwo]